MKRKIFTLLLSAFLGTMAMAQDAPTGVVKKAPVAPVIDGYVDEVWAGANSYNIALPFGSETPTVGNPGETTWRALWIALAEAEKELGLPVTDEQIDEMRQFKDKINYADAEKREKETRHDVMSHVYAYGLQCPKAKPIIHLGATSAYVGDNTDIIVMKQALVLIRSKLVSLMFRLSKFALEYKTLPCLGFTHFQAAQLTTVGKRASLWLQDFYFDFLECERLIETLPLLSCKGKKGT